MFLIDDPIKPTSPAPAVKTVKEIKLTEKVKLKDRIKTLKKELFEKVATKMKRKLEPLTFAPSNGKEVFIEEDFGYKHSTS